MPLEKQVEEHLEILPNGNIQIKIITKIIDDGKQVASNNYRSIVCPGDDVSLCSQRVQDIAASLWTPELIAERQQQNQGI